MKLCGCKEPCFENGEDEWGYLGGVMCKHLSERELKFENETEIRSYCVKYKTPVDIYTNFMEHKRLKQKAEEDDVSNAVKNA